MNSSLGGILKCDFTKVCNFFYLFVLIDENIIYIIYLIFSYSGLKTEIFAEYFFHIYQL